MKKIIKRILLFLICIGIYHIILRGIDRQGIFLDDEDDLRFWTGMEKY